MVELLTVALYNRQYVGLREIRKTRLNVRYRQRSGIGGNCEVLTHS